MDWGSVRSAISNFSRMEPRTNIFNRNKSIRTQGQIFRCLLVTECWRVGFPWSRGTPCFTWPFSSSSDLASQSPPPPPPCPRHTVNRGKDDDDGTAGTGASGRIPAYLRYRIFEGTAPVLAPLILLPSVSFFSLGPADHTVSSRMHGMVKSPFAPAHVNRNSSELFGAPFSTNLPKQGRQAPGPSVVARSDTLPRRTGML